MAKHARTTLRTAWAQALIDDLGASHLIKFYDGTQPASTSESITGALLATLTADSTPGTVASSVLTFDAANYTQTNSAHVTGSPTWCSLQKADGTRVYEFSFTGDGASFSGTITTGQDIGRGAWTWTAPDA